MICFCIQICTSHAYKQYIIDCSCISDITCLWIMQGNVTHISTNQSETSTCHYKLNRSYFALNLKGKNFNQFCKNLKIFHVFIQWRKRKSSIQLLIGVICELKCYFCEICLWLIIKRKISIVFLYNSINCKIKGSIWDIAHVFSIPLLEYILFHQTYSQWVEQKRMDTYSKKRKTTFQRDVRCLFPALQFTITTMSSQSNAY